MIAPEGTRVVIPLIIIGILAMYLGGRLDSMALTVLSWLALVGLIFSMFFFRDPERLTPADPAAITASADGEIVEIREIDDPFVGAGRKISIFMSPLSVHVNRAPCDGIIRNIEHKSGKFLSAFKPEASFENEQCRLTLEKDGLKVVVTQISGFFARRIVTRVKVGQSLTKGERFGMIMFGSRVEMIVPRSYKINIQLGEKVRAGETVLGEIV
jgi:phosphatidylserine decarboxylase